MGLIKKIIFMCKYNWLGYEYRKAKFLKINDMRHMLKFTNFQDSFRHGMEQMRIALEHDYTIKEKIETLEYIINTIKIDIQSDLLSMVIYEIRRERSEDNTNYNFRIFPYNYKDKHGQKHEIKIEEEPTKIINFEKDFVISIPHSKWRFVELVQEMSGKKFEYNKNGHYATFYTGVDICFMNEGRHSPAVAINRREGEIPARVIDLSPLLENIYSDDGINWYDVHSKEPIEKVADFRVALIFEITKVKLKLEKELNKNKENGLTDEKKEDLIKKSFWSTEEIEALRKFYYNLGKLDGLNNKEIERLIKANNNAIKPLEIANRMLLKDMNLEDIVEITGVNLNDL